MGFRLGPGAASGGYRLAAFETIGSTSTEALERARAGDAGRLWVVSKEQTAGRGRRGRRWETASGNLAASLLLRLDVSPAQSATLGFAVGLALVNAVGARQRSSSRLRGKAESGRSLEPGEGTTMAVETQTPHPLAEQAGRSAEGRGGQLRKASSGLDGRLRLKWPNDVLIDGGKVAGILLQAVSAPEGASAIVIGIGVNVLHAPDDLPYPATTLAACGSRIEAEPLFEALAEAWVEQERIWDTGRGFAQIREGWLARAAGLGAPISVKLEDEVFRGTFETIGDDGQLVVRAADGSTKMIAAGDVHFGAAATAGH